VASSSAWKFALPDGFEVASVKPNELGWDVVDGRLVLTPVAPVEKTLVASVELTGEPKDAFAAPLLVPRGAQQLTLLSAVSVSADGLPEVTEPGAARRAEDADLAALPDEVRNSGGSFFVVRDAARPPRWGITWSEEAKVLAAQIDRMLVNVVVGTAGRAAYECWAVVRSSGTTQIELKPPEGLELLAVERDGSDVQPGTSERGLTIPLAAGTGEQVIHVSGLLSAVSVPGEGEMSIPVPSASVPIARVEVRVNLPADRSYTLLQKDRQGPSAASQARRNAARRRRQPGWACSHSARRWHRDRAKRLSPALLARWCWTPHGARCPRNPARCWSRSRLPGQKEGWF